MAQTREKLGDIEQLKGSNALIVSIRAMCRSLDPHTSLISGQELLGVNREETAQGFGLELPDEAGAGPLRVKNVLPGSPAQRAGLRPGDLITHINGRPPDLKGLLALAPWKRTPPALESAFDTEAPVDLTLER